MPSETAAKPVITLEVFICMVELFWFIMWYRRVIQCKQSRIYFITEFRLFDWVPNQKLWVLKCSMLKLPSRNKQVSGLVQTSRALILATATKTVLPYHFFRKLKVCSSFCTADAFDINMLLPVATTPTNTPLCPETPIVCKALKLYYKYSSYPSYR